MPASPVLEMQDVGAGDLPLSSAAPPLSLRLMPGDLCLLDVRDPALAAGFADLCCGIAAPDSGSVRMLGRDWAGLPHEHAAALRGRIGRVFDRGEWVHHLDIADNILLPQLHHTAADAHALRAEATFFARLLGLPGLPLGRVAAHSEADLVRAGLVRALLGRPALLLLDNPVRAMHIDLVPPLLNRIADARDRGAAAIWLTRSDRIWYDRSFPATHRMRLDYRGLLGFEHVT